MNHSCIKRLVTLAIVALLLGEGRTAVAVALQFMPSIQTAGLGRQADVEVLVTDPGTTICPPARCPSLSSISRR